ncbi:MAG: SH3 domain-containing protein [Bergeyella zoohelcum]|nr:SH3 domain-containing protein [Bergeyella zoohelcum]
MTFLFLGVIIHAQIGNYEVTSPELNIRELPDKNSQVIGKFARNQIVQVEEIEGNWAKVSFVDENGNDKIGYASMKFLIPAEEIKKSNKDKTLLYTISILGLVTLIFYIIALIKTRNGEMTTIVNWYDFFLLCASFIFPVIGVILGLQEEENGPGNLGIAGIVLGGLCFIGSAVWSVMENRDNYFHAFLSVMAKVFIVIVMIVVIFIILHNSIRQTKKTVNGRSVSLSVYEQRAHDNNRARNIAMATSVAGFLVLSLIGSHKG